MALFLAVGVGLVAWPLVSYTYPTLFQSQIPFDTLGLNTDSVITPQLSTFIEETLALENITGLSVAVVSKYGKTEFHTWGHRTEDGDEVTPDVRNPPVLFQLEMQCLTRSIDTIPHGIGVQGVLRHGTGPPH